MKAALLSFLWLAAHSAAPAQELTFEVASVKPNPSMSSDVSVNRSPGGGLDAVNVPARALITIAYSLRDQQLIGAPGWLDVERYDIHAKAPAGEPEAQFNDKSAGERMRLRLRALLADRFQLVLHEDTREMPVYALTIGKNGIHPALKRWQDGDEQGPQNIGRNNSYQAKKVSMKAFAEGYLSGRMGRVVVDQTGLSGDYNFKLEFLPDKEAEQKGGMTFLDALEKNLGLKLESRRAPIKVLVIDRVERPAAN